MYPATAVAALKLTLPVVNQIFSFPNTFIENVQVSSNGHVLLTTMDSERLLYTLDPTVKNPVAKPIGRFGNSTGLTGMVPLGHNLYAISGGLHTSFAFERDSMHIYIVSLDTETVIDSIRVPGTATLNGLTPLPNKPWTLLSADSIDGRLFRIDLVTREVSIVSENEALAPSKCKGGPPIGVNGLRTHGEYLYLTNSGRGTFSRVRIDANGQEAGPWEVIARSPSSREIYDDFIFDNEGNAYVAVHPSSVVKITPAGQQTTIAGGGLNSTFKEPTSAALAQDGKSIYVSTGGTLSGHLSAGGQVFQIYL
jgi:hypothetical protein